MTSPLERDDRGNEADYVFGSVLGWDAFEVIRWHAVEGLGEMFAWRIVLGRRVERGPVDADALLDTGATFCIATAQRWRQVHGVIAEVELLEHTQALLLYEVVLAPHLLRAALRRRCRTFVDRSLLEIVEHVLEGRSDSHDRAGGLSPLDREPSPPPERPGFEAFSEPVGRYRWALVERERVDAPRAFVVQYNETDADFVARLLEAEGLTYLFEHGLDACILTISDGPGHAALFHGEVHYPLIADAAGSSRDQEVVRSFQPRRRLRPAAVTMRDYSWRRSRSRLQASARVTGDGALEHYEFPARDEDFPDAGAAPARWQAERYRAERESSVGYATVRTLEPGSRFVLHDPTSLRDDAELYVVRAESYAVELLPESTVLDREPFGLSLRRAAEPFFEVRFEALPAKLPYRPARGTPKPRIFGVHSARVTAEEVAPESPPPELNSDELGRVRLRFPWDQRENDGTPTSKWVRVAQHWAGPGFGALYVPRVGHEVLAAFEDGDPDRPIIVGRVYNAQNRPPYEGRNTTLSTLKSDSVGSDGAAADGFNELRFEDAAQREQVFLHAQRNLDEVVRACHSTSVGGDQSNSVGGDQSNTVYGSRSHQVRGSEQVLVDGPRTTVFGATESHSVTSHRVTAVGGNDTLSVFADHSVNVTAVQRTEVGAERTLKVGADQNTSIGAGRFVRIGATDKLGVRSHRRVEVGGVYSVATTGPYESKAAEHKFECKSFEVSAGGASLKMRAGVVAFDNGAGARVYLVGGSVVIVSGDLVSRSGSHSLDSSGNSTFTAGATTVMSRGASNLVSSGATSIKASVVNAKAGAIKLND